MISEVFSRTCELAIALGYQRINELPGCLEHQVDDQWWFAINAHRVPGACSRCADIPAFTIYFQFNGWPAGMVNADGGTLCAGSLANEHCLIEALHAAIAKAETGSPK